MAAELWPGLWPIALLAAMAMGAVLYRRIYWVGDRTAEDVLPYLRQVNLNAVADLFSGKTELYMALNMTPRDFRSGQRKRMHLALEYIRNISHNALILQQWATYELGRARAAANQECSHLSLDLIAASVQCRMCGFVLRTRLHTWLFRVALLPFVAPPSFDKLIQFGSADLLDFYGKVRSAAAQLSCCYGDSYQNRLGEIL